jgi:hypothetical protein
MVIAAVTAPLAGPAEAVVLTVGPSGDYQTIADAVAAADADPDLANAYDILVAPGLYQNDFAYVSRPLRIAASGGPVVLQATVLLPNEKGIILTTSILEVDELTFTGAAIDASLGGNGAGIRDQTSDIQTSLVIRDSTFIGN